MSVYSHPHQPHHDTNGRPRLAGLAGAVTAAVGVWLVARYGVGVQLRTPGFTSMQHSASLTAGFVLAASTVASLAGWGVVTLIERVTHRPRRAWLTTGLLLTVVSLSAPLSGHGITATERLALVCMHLAVAAVLIPVFALTIRPNQRPVEGAPPVEDAPRDSDVGRRPSSPAEARR